MEARTQLLENQLDALDRLFDSKMTAIDLHALTYATARALPGDPLYPWLDSAAVALADIVGQGLTEVAEREKALIETDALRQMLADALPHP